MNARLPHWTGRGVGLTLLLLVIATLISRPVIACTKDAVDSEMFEERFGGKAGPGDTPNLSNAERVFFTLQSSMETFDARVAKLIVFKSNPEEFGVHALCDRNIVLSRHLLDAIYDNVRKEVADARLAFVLGHELSHLESREHIESGVHKAPASSRKERMLARKKSEERADQAGYLYAARAGYSVHEIFPKSSSTDSFFEFWKSIAAAHERSQYHGSPSERETNIQDYIQELESYTQLFMYGLRAAQFGAHPQAYDMLSLFRSNTRYATSEVFNNQGYVLLQMARQDMPGEMPYRFWLPVLVETQSGIPQRRRGRTSGKLSRDVRRNLNNAVSYFEESLKIRPDLAATINLASALVFLQQYDEAMHIVLGAIDKYPDSLELICIRALLWYELNDELSMWKKAVSSLTDIIDRGGAPHFVYYNVAKLLEEDNRQQYTGAMKYWQQLEQSLVEIPLAYKEVVCDRLRWSEACIENHDYNHSYPTWLSEVQVKVAKNTKTDEFNRSVANWKRLVPRGSANVFEIFQNESGTDTALAIDHYVEFYTRRLSEPEPTEQLLGKYGEPSKKSAFGPDQVWFYGNLWAVWVKDAQVLEYWINRLPGDPAR